MPKVLVQGDANRIKSRYTHPGWDFFELSPPFRDDDFDIIILDHILQQANRLQVPGVLKLYRKALRMEGQLIVIVPSLEWACTQIATQDTPPLTAYLSIYGADQEPSLCGFNLIWLRTEMELAGFQVVGATGEWYQITVGDHQEKVMQNVVTGLKIPDPDPAAAIS